MNKSTLYIPIILIILVTSLVGNHCYAQSYPSYQPPPLKVEFVPGPGYYADSTSVQLLAPGARIYYTTDGSEPRPVDEHRYALPVPVTQNTVIRAIAVMAGEKSHLFSGTYFINEPESTFPVLSVSLPDEQLFDPVTGLFERGINAIDTLWYLPGANFWSRQELTSNVELFEADGKIAWSNEAGFRLFGGMSRLYPQKSFAIVARSRYGDKRIRHKVFGKKGLKKYKFLVLRNSGSDFGQTHFRDALMTHLVKGWDLDIQDYQPAHVYFNGKYHGIYNIREKINKYYLSGHYDVDKDSIDLIEHKITRRNGSTLHYRNLLAFLEENDLSEPSSYAWIESQMDVNNFMDLQIAQIYFDNQDAGGNIKFWRPQTANGRWRWILYDTDWGFGLNDDEAFRNNSLAFHTEPNGPHWPNPSWSTFILRKLLENNNFRREFVTRFCDYLNEDLREEYVMQTIEKFYRRLLPEMPRHLERWGLSQEYWDSQVEVLRVFANARPRYMRKFLKEMFDMGDPRLVNVVISGGGNVVINDRIKIREHFSGKYFEKTPVHLRAKPDLGYRFVRWEGRNINSESPELFMDLRSPILDLRAVFEKFEHPLIGKIIINEVSCNNKQSEDWLEIYNNSKESVNLEGWILADKKNKCKFPKYILPPKGYVVICEDSLDFIKVHPRVQSLIGGLDFGLNKRSEIIQLFSPEHSAVDSISYELEAMDTVFSYDLLLPSLDNGDPGNWQITRGSGTPGAANQYYLMSTIQRKRSLWMQIGSALGIVFLCLILLHLRARKIL